jgi:hypothetical protein
LASQFTYDELKELAANFFAKSLVMNAKGLTPIGQTLGNQV